MLEIHRRPAPAGEIRVSSAKETEAENLGRKEPERTPEAGGMAEYAAIYRAVYEFHRRWQHGPTLDEWSAFIDDANEVCSQHGGGALIRGMILAVINLYWT